MSYISYVRTIEHRERMSQSMLAAWKIRKEAKLAMAVAVSSRTFTETQLASFDALPQEDRIQKFLGIVSLMMKAKPRRSS